MTFGVTPTGFVKKVLTDILDEIKAAELDIISPTLNLLDTSVLGQLNGIVGDKLRELWDVAEANYRSMYPDSSSDEALDQVSSITGAIRLAATKSEVPLDQMFLDTGVTVPAGSIVGIGSSGARFVTLADLVNSTGSPATLSVEAESEDFGVIVGNAKTIDTIQTPVFGWSAAVAITCINLEDYTIDGLLLTLKVDRESEQTVTFPVSGGNYTAAEAALEISSQITDVKAIDDAGFVRITSKLEGEGSAIEITGGSANAQFGFGTDEIKGFNSEDAEVGTDLEIDPDFRSRREQLLRITGSATVDAIRARVREIIDVTQAFVFENVDIDISLEGLPPKSFEVCALGGDEQTIADVIWANKPAGIETHGNVSKTVEDSQGFDHTIKFSRPTPVPIYMELTVSTDPAVFPVDGVAQIKAVLIAEGAAMEIGEDVIALRFKCVPLEITGVLDVTIFLIDDVTPPIGIVNVVIALNELATFDTGDIDVTAI